LYLVQHGKAKSKEEDPDRPLKEVGRQETQLMAELAAKLELEVEEIWHSGKTRAEETAVIFGRALGLMGNVKAVAGLGPTDDVSAVGERLQGLERSIMLVGHLPFLPRLTGWLVSGDPEDAPVNFRNSGIVCLSREQSDWQVTWLLTPG
jgi:phosphohistidine phosphatase